jgi:hypothetical protein
VQAGESMGEPIVRPTRRGELWPYAGGWSRPMAILALPLHSLTAVRARTTAGRFGRDLFPLKEDHHGNDWARYVDGTHGEDPWG